MQTSFLSTILFLFGMLSVSAANPAPSSPEKPCLTCDVATGLTASDITGASATLAWDAVSGATQYDLEAQDEQNNPSTFHLEITVSGNSYAITGLQAGVLYKFKIRTHCGGDKSDWSDWFFFTATGGGNGGGNNGGSGDCGIPAGLGAVVTNGTAALSWTAVAGAVKYYIEVEDEQNVPGTFHLEDSTATNSYTLAGLQSGVLYKFKVRAKCASGQSDWSGWLFFNGAGTGGGGTGDCTAPSALSASVSGTAALLSWNAVSGAVQYNIEIEDEQNTPSNFHLEVSSQDTFYNFTDLLPGVLYKFKVRTQCASGQSDWSAWQYFNGTIGAPPGHGGTGNCAKPTNHLATNITTTTALLRWDSVPGVVSYSLEIERVQQGAAPFQITQTVTTNAFLVTGLSPNTRYKFKVRSNCSATTHSKWTGWRKFKTAASLVDQTADALKPAAAADRETAPSATASGLSLQVWPNPVQSTATVRLGIAIDQTTTLRVFDLSGKMVQEKTIAPQNAPWEGTFSFDQLPNGIYLLQARNAQGSETRKLIVSK